MKKIKINGFFVGDIIGNSYTHENEKYNKKTKKFELFTDRSKFSDDTILSFATIEWLLYSNHKSEEMLQIIKEYYKIFPDRNPTIYGPVFAKWAEEGCLFFRESHGNGGAMRSSPIGWYASSIDEIESLIDKGISPTHNTESGRLGARIVCYTIFYLKNGATLEELKDFIMSKFNIDLNENVDEYRDRYVYTSNAIETIRPAIITLLNSNNFEDAIRNAVSFGGDTDTITTICSAISEAYYKEIPNNIVEKAKTYLPEKFLKLIKEFNFYINKKFNK